MFNRDVYGMGRCCYNTTSYPRAKKKTHPQILAQTLALKWYPQDLIGQVKLLTSLQPIRIRAAFSAGAFPVWPARGAFYRGQLVIWRPVLIIIEIYRSPQGPMETLTKTNYLELVRIRRRTFLWLSLILGSCDSY